MFRVEMLWGGSWVPLPLTFASRDDAEWAVAMWKKANRCYSDPFRTLGPAGEEWSLEEVLAREG